jgi:hypothetical protein
MLARVVRVIRVAVRCRRLVSGLAATQAGEESGLAATQAGEELAGKKKDLDWLLHKQEESWMSGVAVRC